MRTRNLLRRKLNMIYGFLHREEVLEEDFWHQKGRSSVGDVEERGGVGLKQGIGNLLIGLMRNKGNLKTIEIRFWWCGFSNVPQVVCRTVPTSLQATGRVEKRVEENNVTNELL
ncbi:hypothetical protein NPIL_187201 [Nephila pilipes]|uniref:Uncharacterized protein n=1 Tax=Nephila pilipes TaxID=299642 RepID=A0A8X6TXB8_NEPPI|nr:hypothetical protein NPIL_187201 [Nephila pilipes]